MTAKELMIGDLVNYNGSVAKINSGRLSFLAYVEENPESEEAKVIGKYEPIPLTEEILKANGFRRIGFHKLDFVRDEVGFISYNTVTHCVSVGCDGIVKKNIGYVHELQHALRLCGLDELADNFKIQ